jgi:hypothetical protein
MEYNFLTFTFGVRTQLHYNKTIIKYNKDMSHYLCIRKRINRTAHFRCKSIITTTPASTLQIVEQKTKMRQQHINGVK